MQGIFDSRNLVIFVTLVMGMIIGASLAAYKKKDQVDVVEDAVNVVVPGNALLVSDQFRAGLTSLDAAGTALAIVNAQGTLRAVTMDGKAIDLCGLGKDTETSDRTCRLRISLSELIAHLAGRAQCPTRCPDEQGDLHACVKATNKYDCNDSTPTSCSEDCK